MGRAILKTASLLVPAARRREWLLEWTAELWHLERDPQTTITPARFCSGCFRDAVYLRAATFETRGLLALSSPGSCLGALGLAVAAAACLMWMTPAVRNSVWPRAVALHAVLATGAVLLYRASSGSFGLRGCGARGWRFLAAKSALAAALVYLGSFDVAPLISRTPIPQIALVGYVVACRWAVSDQRRRCPRCLRRLTHPVRIGHSAGTLLDWYGEEFLCAHGHGVLHEPEQLENSYCARQWVGMDASWRELFEPAERR